MAPSDPNPAPRRAPSREAAPGSMAERIQGATRRSMPAPPGRNLALLLIGVALVVALWIQFAGGSGPGRTIREGAEGRDRAPRLPAQAPVESAPPAGDAAAGAGAPRERASPLPAPMVPVPEGLPSGLARELGTALPQLGAAREDAERAFRELPRLVAATPEAKRAEVVTLVLDNLAVAATLGPYRRQAFDTAVALGATGEGARALADLAVRRGLDDDGAAAAAILFLSRQPGTGGPPAVERLDALILDGYRPLHLRVLAARARPREGRPEALTVLAEDPATPAALAEALR